MKIRSVELTNFRKFVGTVRIDSIGDNVNILVGRNELGKSTLLQAINAVIFDKARSTAGHVKAFRHFLNGTVPEVKLAFDIEGQSWSIQKRFALQAGKAVLTCSNGRIFEDDAAETELQRLLGFTGGRGGGEPGIWGTLWVQQGHSFGDTKLNEPAQRTIQGCLESQVGLVTGGARGQKIPNAVRKALEDIQSQKGPRGRFREVTERLNAVNTEIVELQGKANNVSDFLTELTVRRRDLRETLAGWDDTQHRAELERERNRRVAASTLAAEIVSAGDAAKLARERATHMRQSVIDRANAVRELTALEFDLTVLSGEASATLAAKNEASTIVDQAHRHLVSLRSQASQSNELGRRLDRIRAYVALSSEIGQHQATIDRAAALDAEAVRLSELIGSIAATDEAVTRIEEAVTEVAAAEAAANAVATTVFLAIEDNARGRISVDGRPLSAAQPPLSILARAVIGIEEVGSISIEPQIKNRTALTNRRAAAIEELRQSLEAAGASDLPAARAAAGLRREHVRQLADVRREIANLAPGNRQRKIPAGLDVLKSYLGELRGRLKSEMELLNLDTLPEEDALAAEVSKNHEIGAQLASDIATAEAALAGPQHMLAEADKKLRKVEGRVAELKGTIGTRRADLDAIRSVRSDATLAEEAGELEVIAAEKESEFAAKQSDAGDTVEAIDARIRRLEGAAANHTRAVGSLNNDITRLAALIEASECTGVEELLLASEAERDRLAETVAEFEQEAAILQLLLETLETAEREAKNRYLAPVVSRVQPYLKMLLPGSDIVLDENLQIAGLQRGGEREDFEFLSGGTQEQLAVLTRLAFAELLLQQGRPATVILDDALAFSDDDRIESMFDVLMRAGEQTQIIVLTCRKKLFTRLGAAPLELRKASFTAHEASIAA